MSVKAYNGQEELCEGTQRPGVDPQTPPYGGRELPSRFLLLFLFLLRFQLHFRLHFLFLFLLHFRLHFLFLFLLHFRLLFLFLLQLSHVTRITCCDWLLLYCYRGGPPYISRNSKKKKIIVRDFRLGLQFELKSNQMSRIVCLSTVTDATHAKLL